jgi:hypothetical protein
MIESVDNEEIKSSENSYVNSKRMKTCPGPIRKGKKQSIAEI